MVARRYLSTSRDHVVLHDLATGHRIGIGRREWVLLEAADGTRDVAGILLAAEREGSHATADMLVTFLDALGDAGLLDEGIIHPKAPPETDYERQRLELPVEPLPRFSLHCDGRGSCCRLYDSVLFSPVDAARARALVPGILDGGARHEAVFLPECGSGPSAACAVALRDGACAYLGDDRACLVHAAGGSRAKPLGCRTYPAVFCDDGESLRVSVAVECACVLASVGRASGTPLVPVEAKVWADLEPGIHVVGLPDPVPVCATRVVARAEYVAWTKGLVADPPAGDVVTFLLAMADRIMGEGLAPTANRFTAIPPEPRADMLRPWLEALRRCATTRAAEDKRWRSERDLARRASAWIAIATTAMLEPRALDALLAPPLDTRDHEAFYLRAALHGHRLVGKYSLDVALRDAAVRMLVARALLVLFATLPEGELDPACEYPLALVEATLRGQGLDVYVDDVAG